MPAIYFLKTIVPALLLFLSACTKKAEDPPPVPNIPFTPVQPTQPLKMLALGDSYTIGQSVTIDERFPHQTAALLRQQNRSLLTPEYVAQTGWTTANLLTAIDNAGKPFNFDIVTLLIGVNNQYQGRDTNEYRIQFTQCLQKAIQHAGERRSRVFVLSIPDYGATPFGKRLNPVQIANEINAFNRINEAITKSFGITYIEITEGSRQATNDPSLVAVDGLHPSGKEYAKWAQKLSTQILQVLR
jgi:lysophospholipase L1-like esterase